MYHVCIISYRDVCFICHFHILLKGMANYSFLYYIVNCRDSTDNQNHNTCKTAKCLLNDTPNLIENHWNINKLIFNFYLYWRREMYEVGKWRLTKLYDHICTLDSWLHFPPLSYYSVQFSHSVVSDSLRPHELQHTRPPCPSPTPRVYSNSCPLSQWCHPAISSSVLPFSSCLQSFPASGSFQTSQFFTVGGQSIGVSASTPVLPMNIQDWFILGWTGWISL